MPIYDYECRNCGHKVEVLHGVNDPGPTACERCGGQMRKLFSTPAIVFRGSGFAKKDFRDSRSAAKAGKETAAAGAAEGSSSVTGSSGSEGSTKSDSQAASKSTDGIAKQTTGKPSAPSKAVD